MDNLVRLFFAFDNVRSALCASVPDPSLGVIDPASVSQGEARAQKGRASSQPLLLAAPRDQFAAAAKFSRGFSASILRRKESFQLTPVLN